MRFIAYITGGFYYSVDENLEMTTILDRRLFYYYNLCSSIHQTVMPPETPAPFFSSSSSTNNNNESTQHLEDRTNTPSQLGGNFNSCDENESESSRDINMIKNSDKISLNNRSKIMKKLAAATTTKENKFNELHNDIWSLFAGDAPLNEQMFEFKCIQRYELSQRASNMTLLQLVRIRAHEGFYLARVSHEIVKPTKSSR